MAKNKITTAIQMLEADTNNAVAYIYQTAQFQAGPLTNYVLTLKDIFATHDAPTQASSQILKNFTPLYDATIVTKLRHAGAAIVAKVHSDELALGGSGQFSSFGVINHPHDKQRIVGGSSSGSAATMTKAIDVSIGSDTGDSVRLPASYNGLVGFKPTYGAVSRFGMFAYASSLDTVGWFAHNVTDIIKIAHVLYGQDPKDLTSIALKLAPIKSLKPTKVAYLKVAQNEVKPYVWVAYQKLLENLKEAGITLQALEVDAKLLRSIGIIYDIISFSEASSNIANLSAIGFGVRQSGADWIAIMTNSRSVGFSEMVKRRMTLGAFYLEQENQYDYFLRAQKIRRLITEQFAQAFLDNELLIYPSAPEIAPLIKDGKMQSTMTNILISANLSGRPSLTLKWAKHQKLPFGLQLDGQKGADQQLLASSLWFEQFLGAEDE